MYDTVLCVKLCKDFKWSSCVFKPVQEEGVDVDSKAKISNANFQGKQVIPNTKFLLDLGPNIRYLSLSPTRQDLTQGLFLLEGF